jgi:hypothetical protein
MNHQNVLKLKEAKNDTNCCYFRHQIALMLPVAANGFVRQETSTQKSPPPPTGATAPTGPGPPHYPGFTITLRHTTLGRTPLDEGPARRRDLYLTTHITHKRQTYMPPAGFEPAIPASERPQTHALDGKATGTSQKSFR